MQSVPGSRKRTCLGKHLNISAETRVTKSLHHAVLNCKGNGDAVSLSARLFPSRVFKDNEVWLLRFLLRVERMGSGQQGEELASVWST